MGNPPQVAEQCAAQSGTPETRSYTLTFTSNWTATGSGRAVPGGAHLTGMRAATHNSAYTMWRVGGLATTGVETLAETGGGSPLSTEIQARIRAGTANMDIAISGLGATGSTSKTFTVTSTHSLLSSVSMVAPTSDWFVGLSSYCLLDSDGNWKSDVTIPLRIYDAGTEQEVTLFSLGNPAESPHKPISRFPGSAEAGFLESANMHIIGSLRLQCTDCL